MKKKINSKSNVQGKRVMKLSAKEKLSSFNIEELDGRLETAWNDVCPKN